MASPNPEPKKVSSVRLLPWDPDSPEHVKRLFDQRVACTWKSELVNSWIPKQKSGKYTIQWIILADTDPEKSAKLQMHATEFPKEALELSDTATSLGGKPRVPTEESFLPVGHISLYTQYEQEGLDESIPVPGVYYISTFYVSAALQSSGLGRAAMDAVEHMAISEPLNAKTLVLSTVANEYEGRDEKWAAFGRIAPKISNQDWYGRRGYVVYKTVDNFWWEKDKNGKDWPATAVFMRKNIT